ncbi:MAG: hypothetical protein GY820_27655 [Gammaproteobacteria bacterium]|nr:hypothetical protein [Gammaproteobacteria bacterium]
MMKFLDLDEAKEYLDLIKLKLNDWNGIESKDKANKEQEWLNIAAPHDENLLSFCHHIVSWLPEGKWKIFQIDNSTGWMDPVQLSLFAGLLRGVNHYKEYDQDKDRTIFFDFGIDDGYADLLIANLTYVFLLFRLHGYIVSSGSINGEILAIQDGYVYFISNKKVVGVEELIKNINSSPLLPPKWLQDFIDNEVDKQI